MQVIVTADGTRYDLADPNDRYTAVELALVVIQDYRRLLSDTLNKEKSRPTPNPAWLRDLEHAFAETRLLRISLVDEPEKLARVLQDLLPMVNILGAATKAAPGSTSAELAA